MNDQNPFVYRYNISNGTQSLTLNAVANNSSKISINGGEFSSNNIGEVTLTDIQKSQVIRISVQAEDNSIQHYMVVIDKEKSTTKFITYNPTYFKYYLMGCNSNDLHIKTYQKK